MPRRAIVVALAALAPLLPPSLASAAPTGVARIVAADGTVLQTASATAGYAFPADGSLVQIADVTGGRGTLRLRGISLLGGRIAIDRALVGSTSGVAGVSVDGRPLPAGDNTVVGLPGVGWALVLQRAVIPLASGATRATTVAVRLHLQVAVGTIPAGADVLVGYAAGAATTPALTGAAGAIPASLVPIYRAAGRQYGVPWAVLAAINRVETAFGSNLGVSSAGAEGWMQFLPSTWQTYGVDANGDGKADPYDPQDAIFAAARLLAASGAAHDLAGAVFSYNHSQSYVATVLGLAAAYGNGTSAPAPSTLDQAASQASSDDDSRGFSPVALW